MARARNIKPGFFENEFLAELPAEARLLFIGLWTMADREGRLEDRPKRIKMKLMPCDDVSVDKLLQALSDAGFIERYGECTWPAPDKHQAQYIQIVKFTKHQSPHVKEAKSTIPAPDKHQTSTGQAGKRKLPTPPDSLNPDSLNEDEEPNGSSGEQDSPAAYSIPLSGKGKFHHVTAEDLAHYRKTYPAVDVDQSFRNMLEWLELNKRKRSGSVKGAKSRITSWLSRDQDKASKAPQRQQAGESDRWLRGVQ